MISSSCLRQLDRKAIKILMILIFDIQRVVLNTILLSSGVLCSNDFKVIVPSHIP